MFANVLAMTNAVLAGIITVFALRYLRSHRPYARALKVAYAIIGAYWCGLYIWVAVTPIGAVDPVWFGQTFVRPAFTVTLAVMASGAVYRWRSND